MPQRHLHHTPGGTGDHRLGERIRKLRLACNMSQTDLARTTGRLLKHPLSQECVSQYETGQRTPPLRVLNTLARALNTTVADLLAATTEEKTGQPTHDALVLTPPARRQAITHRIRELVAREYTQTGFAQRIGIPPQFVTRYLHGTLPGPEILLRIAHAYSVTIEWILTGQRPGRHHAPAAVALTLNAYQARTRLTAQYPRRRLLGLYYTTMGLAGEAGEISNKVSKLIRDHNEQLTDSAREAIADELGDVLWFTAGVAHELHMALDDIAAANLAKLKDRKQRGAITGSGDSR